MTKPAVGSDWIKRAMCSTKSASVLVSAIVGGEEFASSKVEIAGQDLCAMSDGVELAAFYLACFGR